MTYNTIIFTVHEPPFAKQRPRFSSQGGWFRSYTPAKTHRAEKLIRRAFDEQCKGVKIPLNGPISVTIKFLMPIPGSLSKKKKEALKLSPHVKRPDIDNLMKTVCDALNNYVFSDDSQIYLLTATKAYTDGEPRTLVEIVSLGEDYDNTTTSNS